MKSSPHSLESYIEEVGYKNISKDDLENEINRYRTLGKDEKTLDFIAKFLILYGLRHESKQWTFENTEYTNSYTKIYFTCKKHGIKQNLPYKILNRRLQKGCDECGHIRKHKPSYEEICNSMNRMSANRLFKTFKEAFDSFGFKNIAQEKYSELMASYSDKNMDERSKLLIGIRLLRFGYTDSLDFSQIKYINNRTNIDIKCEKHGWYQQSPGNFIRGYNCIKCIADKQRMKYEEMIKDQRYEYNDDWNKEHWKGLFGSIVKYKCKKHGEITQNSYIHFAIGCGCPFCSESHMERDLHNKLVSFGLEQGKDFVREKTFNDLKSENGGLLRFDFYIPRLNLLIELDGEQHYTIDGNNLYTQKKLEQLQRNDKLKTKYAVEHKFKFIRIKYNQFKKWLNKITSLESLDWA